MKKFLVKSLSAANWLAPMRDANGVAHTSPGQRPGFTRPLGVSSAESAIHSAYPVCLKTIHHPTTETGLSFTPVIRLKVALLLLFAATNACFALIPEPDNLLYGTISLDGAPVTANMTNVVVEVYRATNSPAVARYQMGSNPQFGNFYSLRVPVESVTPIANSSNSQVGDTLLLVLRDTAGVRAQTNFTITDRGTALRVDFGPTVSDVDGDGLPDGWEIRWFGGLGKKPGDLTPSGQTVVTHFIAGTDPNSQVGFQLNINVTNKLKRVWFYAAAAQGPGYDGMTRLYTLQYRPALDSGAWADLAGYVSLTGTNQLVEYFTAGLGGPGYYRCGITLLGFNLITNAPSGDTDGDGLPDAWETLYFGSLTRGASFVCANGLTTLQNYIEGTDPNNPSSAFKLNLTRTNNQAWVTFRALPAQGTGYTGVTRYYSLESSTNPSGVFVGVVGYSNIVGGDQLINYPVGTEPHRFFRGRVWLQSP
jgi:hypothetical protein